MNIINICWVMSVIIWAIFSIAMVVCYKINKPDLAIMFNVYQIVMIVFIWGFLIMGA